MRKISYVVLSAVLLFSACKNESFKKGKDGLEYKLISIGNASKIKNGEFMQIHVGQYYATGKTDSLLSDTRTSNGPLIEKMDSTSIPASYYEILSQLKKDDSLVMRILTDSAFAKSPESMPPFLKKGHFLITTIKVLNVFANDAEADSARRAEMRAAQKRDSIKSIETLAKEDKTLQDYFTKNNIKAVKAPGGTYVEIITPGTGNNIDTTVVVTTNYTGKTMDGKMFDSNTDPSKGHVEPFNVNMTSDRALGTTVIKGWTDGLTLLNKGAKAKFYIPSALAYGPRESPEIPANSILIFDIEVLDVLTKEQAKIVVKEQLEKNKLRQKAYMDSISKLNSQKMDTSIKK